MWLPTPGGLTQSNVGIKGRETITPGLDFVFDLNFGFNPYSLTPANGPASFLDNNGIALAKQTSNADSSRAGQFYNSVGYAGFSSPTYGTLTFGRQNSLELDGVLAYDPMGASYALLSDRLAGNGGRRRRHRRRPGFDGHQISRRCRR